MKLRWFSALIAIAVIAFLLTPPPYSEAQQPRRGGVLRVAHVGEPPTLDLHWTTNWITMHIMTNVAEGLFAMNARLEPRPVLLDRWTKSADRLTYTFSLRRGIRFHNGEVLTSEDVKASLERWGRIGVRGRRVFANVAAVTTPDQHTVVIRLREPYALLLAELAFYEQPAVIFPKETIVEAGTGPLRRFIGTGPYRVAEHVPDRHIRLDRFDGFISRTEEPDGMTGRKHAHFDSIFIHPVPDAAVRIAGVKRGEFHLADTIPPDEYVRLRAHPELVPAIMPLPVWLAAVFNHRTGLMTNRKVRQAFQAALDCEAVLRAAFGHPRFWRLEASLMPRGHHLWTDAGREFYCQNNPGRARQLLAEAGYRGEPVRWLTTMEYPHHGIAATVVKPMLERVGFNVELQFVDWATLLTRRARPELWDVFSTGFGVVPDPAFMLVLQPGFPGWYENREMNAMITLLRRHADPRVRRDLWARMQRLWYEEAGAVNFGHTYRLHLHRRELRGFTNMPNHVWWNAWLERR
jgi:peptide/nickel transport system substrate-binding protein